VFRGDIAKISGHVFNAQAEIHYVVYGEGEPVLLMHGGLSHKLTWFAQIPILVRKGFQVILMDTRGHGKSTHDVDTHDYELYASDALKVLDALNITKVDLIGWSDGGNTALTLASKLAWTNSQRIRKIITISANYHPTGLTSMAYSDNTKVSRGLILWGKKTWSKMGKHYQETERHIKNLWQSAPNFTSDELARIKNPTLIIVGEKDHITVAHSRSLANILPLGELSVIQGAGHAAPLTHSANVNALILTFLLKK